ncbi:copper-binding protein [Rhodococcus triatomae]|uniref:Plastocyanin n=1 Tax=Rhodococcus triatomae TaxID=300028 RepID=A0A1G8A5W6_9NOCA|nr:plastocyanin/azurin family copper-binding protein [Rhodococcus triatomae]QNG17849.1 copper-binding protein [Rhodococcus triatomae]QNG22483.1 copper-binding protein [Rhodococcus triatomae]SDH16329.1 Plastocyanin [Rhodococcus triatomae]
MKKLLALLVASLAAFTVSACSGADASSAEPAVVVEVKNMAYSPATVTIEKGQTVQWQFDDSGLPHDVVGDGALGETLRSELLTEGTYSYTFEEAGTFSYHCTPHPAMVGTVIVQ